MYTHNEDILHIFGRLEDINVEVNYLQEQGASKLNEDPQEGLKDFESIQHMVNLCIEDIKEIIKLRNI